jgi:hypothetical protein
MTRLCSLVAVALVCLVVGPAFANRCGDQNPARCGLDSQTDPPDPMFGDTGGCTEASLGTLPLFERTGSCQPGDTMVIYDLSQPFPDNGLPEDSSMVAGLTSFMTLRAGQNSACAHMVDTVDPKPCPDPRECPNQSTQPEGAIKVPITGYMVGCWTPPDHDGCRDVAFYTKAICVHAGHELLGPGCTNAGDIDCANVSTEQVAIDVPGAKNRRTCPPADSTKSCRAVRRSGDPGFRFWIGGFCSTNNCNDPGTSPVVGDDTCKVAWGATKLGYDFPDGKGINEPGWYDWKTGSFKIDVSSPKPTCGALGQCLGERAGVFWDLRLIATPRSGQTVPCVGGGPNACDAGTCAP